MLRSLLALLALASWVACVHATPPLAPIEYARGEPIALQVHQLTSDHTQLPIPYENLPFCVPPVIKDDQQAGTVVKLLRHFARVLLGWYQVENSPYLLLPAVENIPCAKVCDVKTLTNKDINAFIDAIEQEYRVQWVVDHKKAYVQKMLVDENGSVEYLHKNGYAVGEKNGLVHLGVEPTVFFLNSHVELTISY